MFYSVLEEMVKALINHHHVRSTKHPRNHVPEGMKNKNKKKEKIIKLIYIQNFNLKMQQIVAFFFFIFPSNKLFSSNFSGLFYSLHFHEKPINSFFFQ